MQMGEHFFFEFVVAGLGEVAGAVVPGLLLIQGYPGLPG